MGTSGSHTSMKKWIIHWTLIGKYISNPSDWQHVSTRQVVTHGGSSLLNHYNFSLHAALQAVYSNICFPSFVHARWNKAQRLVHQFVQRLFEGHRIEWNYVKKRSTRMELDVFVPSRSLAFEYNGEYHYHDVLVYPKFDEISVYKVDMAMLRL